MAKYRVILLLVSILILLTCILEPKEPTERENKALTDSLLWTAWGRADTTTFTTITAVYYDSVYFYQENDTNKYVHLWGMWSADTMLNFGKQGLEYGCFVIGRDSIVLYNRFGVFMSAVGNETTAVTSQRIPLSNRAEELLFPNHIDGISASFRLNPDLDLRYPTVSAGQDTTICGGDTVLFRGHFAFPVTRITGIDWRIGQAVSSHDSNLVFVEPNYACTLSVSLTAYFGDGNHSDNKIRVLVSDSLLWLNDSMVVQTVLHANSITNKSVGDVSTRERGRISALNLENCGIESLPPVIGKLDYLKSLKLQSNSLRTLPSEIGNLKSLNSLYLGGNLLAGLPSEIGNLKLLETLNLGVYLYYYSLSRSGENFLDSLPASIGNLSNLRYLYAGACGLRSLPESICNLTNLSYLNVRDNQLTHLPLQIGNLGYLSIFWAQYNALLDLPPSIGNLGNLYYLDMNHNQLSQLPDEITSLKLSTCRFYSNTLCNIPDTVRTWLDHYEPDWEQKQTCPQVKASK